MPAETKHSEVLNGLLDELDVKAGHQQTSHGDTDYWVCHRKHARYPFRCECIVRFMTHSSNQPIAEMTGRTRNLSRGGVGVLVRRVFVVGDPVELQVMIPDRPEMYMAGIVSFCRYAGRGFHEIGLTLKEVGSKPVFSHDPTVALQVLPWLQGLGIRRPQ